MVITTLSQHNNYSQTHTPTHLIIHTHTHTHSPSPSHKHTHTDTLTNTHTHTHTYTHTRRHTHTSTHTHTQLNNTHTSCTISYHLSLVGTDSSTICLKFLRYRTTQSSHLYTNNSEGCGWSPDTPIELGPGRPEADVLGWSVSGAVPDRVVADDIDSCSWGGRLLK